jgi:lipopolysaccharide/colanic/teichoic acid biosynthesis glycosyltransferase
MPAALRRLWSSEPAVPLRAPRLTLVPNVITAPRVIDDELFRGVLVRERKRADRTNESLVLTLVTLPDAQETPTPLWVALIDALAAAKGETELLGWFGNQRALALLTPDVAVFNQTVLSDLNDRIRREFALRLDADTASRVSIRVYVHPHSAAADAEGVWPIEPLVNMARAAERRRTRYTVLKRALDVMVSLTLLALLAPLFLVIAALVKLTSQGPALFRQERVGQMMKPFMMLKFRTMHVNGDDTIHQKFVSSFITARAEPQQMNGAAVFKITNDPRITSIGRILRKTSLDELPQLWNVLRGEMSLVGPRPPLPYEVERYKSWHKGRVLEAKPGVTGLWQVSGRSSTTFDEMVRLDLQYARTCSLGTDLRILLATPRAVISGKGAC